MKFKKHYDIRRLRHKDSCGDVLTVERYPNIGDDQASRYYILATNAVALSEKGVRKLAEALLKELDR
jgi:hypothetical protein